MQSFLRRHRKKGSPTKGTHKTKITERDTVCALKYQDVVSKSMDSLLTVASSIPLPADIKLSVDPSIPRPIIRGQSRKLRDKPHLLQRHSDQDIPDLERRHSFDFVIMDKSSEDDDEMSEVSHSLEPSPLHDARGRSDSSDSRDTLHMTDHALLYSLEQSTSLASDREAESDDERSFVSLQSNDYPVYVLSEDSGDTDNFPQRLSGGSRGAEVKQDGNLQQRQNALMEHSFFMLEVRLKEGRDLVVRDSCGTSDPYVKFKLGGRVVYKSRIIFKNLNPKWDETFTIPLSNISKPILVKVFDYDRGFHDDPMGTSVIDMSQLELGKPTELKLMLSDRGKSDYMGYLLLTCSLIPKTQEEKEQYYNQKSVRKVDPSKKLKMQQWSSVVTILLVDGKDLVPMDDNGLSDPYVKFKLGNEKYRSKHKNKTLNPRWLEQFDLRLYEDQPNILEINVYDYDVTAKDDFMGRAVINLAELEQEVTHTLNVELEDGAGVLKLMLTISGSAGQESASGLCNFTPSLRQHNEIRRRYSIMKSFSQMEDVGFLQVKVFKAEDLKGADLSGLSDPFCVLELVNSRVQTHTEFKTLNPEWNKIFTFKLKDIHSALDITVYDADRSGKFEFLGRVAIPLLKITSGERKWYSLKDKKLVHRSKGAILLEMDLVFNPIKAAIRTVNPTEQKIMQLEPKFRINVMKTNIERVSKLVNSVIEIGQFLKSCFNWESKPRSATAFLVFLIMVWNFELYLLPVSLLLLFLKNLIIAHLIGAFKRESIEDVKLDEDEDEDDEDKEKIPQPKEEKKSFKERLQSIQDVCLQVQQGMDEVASLGERIKNTFNWSVPWLSTLAVVVLSVAAIILYLVPLRIIVLIWGINKFTKKLRQPKAINNNEVLDFLSRVPCDREVIEYRELKLDIPSSNKKKRS